jgi:hypothetical protein
LPDKEVQYWVKNFNDRDDHFERRLDPSGLSFYSGNSYKRNKANLFNDETCVRDGKDRKHLLVNNVKYISDTLAQIGDFHGETITTTVAGTTFSTKKASSSRFAVTTTPTSSIIGKSKHSQLSKSAKTALDVKKIPNNAATVNIRLVSDTSITVTNALLKVTKVDDTGTTPENMNFKVYEIRHPETDASVVGSGASSWTDIPANTGVSAVSLTHNPGISGIATGVASTRHDWFLALSTKSIGVGEQSFRLIFDVEYL